MRGIYESFLAIGVILIMATSSAAATCKPTPADQLGPFYKLNAPMRTSVGQGYVLSGAVKSSKDCAPIEGARIEFWLAASNGKYDDDHRATVSSDKSGSYQFESNSPPGYSGRPPHIHIRVSASGYKTLVTQHYPVAGQTTATFDLVLVPEKAATSNSFRKRFGISGQFNVTFSSDRSALVFAFDSDTPLPIGHPSRSLCDQFLVLD